MAGLLNRTEDITSISEKLLENDEKIGVTLDKFYGEDVATNATNLLKQHSLIAFELFEAIKNKENAKIEDSDKKWRSNSQEIAALLSATNEKIIRESLQEKIDIYLDLTKKSFEARINKNWQEEIETFETLLDLALESAEVMAKNSISQYPEKF